MLCVDDTRYEVFEHIIFNGCKPLCVFTDYSACSLMWASDLLFTFTFDVFGLTTSKEENCFLSTGLVGGGFLGSSVFTGMSSMLQIHLIITISSCMFKCMTLQFLPGDSDAVFALFPCEQVDLVIVG